MASTCASVMAVAMCGRRSDYFTVRDGKIVSLKVIRNQPSPY